VAAPLLAPHIGGYFFGNARDPSLNSQLYARRWLSIESVKLPSNCDCARCFFPQKKKKIK